MSELDNLILATEKTTPKGFCNPACQELLVTSALWISAIVGFISLALVTNLIRRNLKSFTAPEIQEKLIIFLLYLPVLISINCMNTIIAKDDTPTIVDVIRRLFQMWGYYSFWRMTENYVEESRVKDILQRKMFGYQLPPFKYCIRPYKFVTEESYVKSMKRIRIFILQAIGFQAFALICDVMHDYKWIYNSSADASKDEITDIARKQAAFNYFYTLLEAISLTVGAYFILTYNKMLTEEYKYTNWGWKFIILMIMMLLVNWQWVFLQGRKDSIFVGNFDIVSDIYREDHLLLCLNCILLAPETLLATILALHAFDPAEFEDETRLGFRGTSEMSLSAVRASGGKNYENVTTSEDL